jgi:hypothetical protein
MPFLQVATHKDGYELWHIVVYGRAVESNSSDRTDPRDRNFGNLAGRGVVGGIVDDGSLQRGRHCPIQLKSDVDSSPMAKPVASIHLGIRSEHMPEGVQAPLNFVAFHGECSFIAIGIHSGKRVRGVFPTNCDRVTVVFSWVASVILDCVAKHSSITCGSGAGSMSVCLI